MQFITCRSENETQAFALLANLYNSEEGKQGYLNVLQASSNTVLAGVTGVADLQLLQAVQETEPPEVDVETTEAPMP